MNARERQLAALNRKPTDRISIDVIAIENTDKLQAYLGDGINIYDYLGIDGRIISPDYTGKLSENKNAWSLIKNVPYSTIYEYPVLNNIDDYIPPNPDMYNFIQSAKLAMELSKKYVIRGPGFHTLFCRLSSLCGMEEAMIKMYNEPVEFDKAIEMIFQNLYKFTENYLEAMGDHLDVLLLGDDVACQRGMLFSPDLWRKFFKNRWAKLFELGINRNKFIWFHSCGNILDILPDLIEIGVNVWETVQLHTLPISAKELKREYGKDIIFCGGINTQTLPFKTPLEIAKEVREKINTLYADGEGYICGPDHHIKYNFSVENTIALFLTAKNG